MTNMTNTNRLELRSSIAQRIIVALGTISIFFTITANSEEKSLKPAVYEEVIVTARKREEKLIDIPISVSVVTDESIKNYQIQSITDLAYHIPGMSNVSPDATVQNISIRGVNNPNGTSPLTGIYLDEIPLSFAPGTTVDLQTTDIQRVEVLKGPQGTLFGQGSMNGTVRFISKKPSFNGVNGEIGVSAYDTEDGDISSELEAVINLPVITNTLGFRVSASAKNVEGWIDQPNTNTDNANSNELSYVHLKGLWKVTDKFTVDTQIMRYDSDIGAPNVVNFGSVFDLESYVSVADGFVPSTDISYNYDIQNLTLSYDLDFATLISSSSHISSERLTSSLTNVNEVAGSFQEFLTADLFAKVDGISQEIRLNGEKGELDWIVGVFFTDNELENGYASIKGFIDDVRFFESSNFESSINHESTSYFFDLSYDINNRLTISAGTRYYEGETSDEFSIAGTILDTPKSNFHKLSSKVSLTYSMTDTTNIYARIAEGFRSGGNNVLSLETYDPESLMNYEIGVKSSLFEDRLVAEAAIYLSRYKDYQEIEYNPITFQRLLLNPGAAEIKGIEWSTQMKVTEQLTLGFSGHFSENEFTKLNSGVNIKNVGDELNFTPKYSYSLTSTYNFKLPSATPGYFHISYNRQGEQYLISRPVVLKSSPLGYLNVHIGAKLTKFNIALFGRNLTNELRSTTPNNIDKIPNRPRTYGVRVSYEF